MAYQPRLPAAVLELAQLVPNEFDEWLTKHTVSLPALFSAYKSAQNDLELAISHDRITYKHVPRAIYSFVAPAINLSTDPKKPPTRISPAARTQLENIFKSAQVLKAEAVAKAKAETATKVPVDPKAAAEKEVADKIKAALLLLPGIVQHQGDTDFFLDNLQKLFNRLLSADQAKAVHAALAKSTEPAEDAKALIKIAKIEDDQARRDYALQLAR